LTKHCPLQTRRKIAPSRQVNRWLSDRAVEAKRVRRRLKRKWKSKGNRNDYVAYRQACRVANKEITKARSDFYSSRIAEAAEEPRRRWSAIRDVLHLTETKTDRSADESEKLCNAFAVFFDDKIQKAKEAIKTQLSSHGTQPLQFDTAFAGSPLDDLQPPTEDKVRRLISTMPNKSSLVDSIPTSVIKSCYDVFALLIAHLAKLSFSEGKFPSRYKTASVTPLLKKKELDPDIASNYRPISNLYTISKMLERLFMAHMRPHVESCANFNRYQSAYRRGHSTETTLLRVLDDDYHAADNHSRSLLLQLDLSAAFDTLDKPTLMHRL